MPIYIKQRKLRRRTQQRLILRRSLQLYPLCGGGWMEGATTCAPPSQIRQTNWLTICQPTWHGDAVDSTRERQEIKGWHQLLSDDPPGQPLNQINWDTRPIRSPSSSRVSHMCCLLGCFYWIGNSFLLPDKGQGRVVFLFSLLLELWG